ncbi:hypothetical protein JCM10908_004912 [Rhodotorula pacifica]|uniref:uncharacterized protein n=1 Tax=Rhodotorula pacifica TaxID=1495444 RepID=UPI003180DF90
MSRWEAMRREHAFRDADKMRALSVPPLTLPPHTPSTMEKHLYSHSLAPPFAQTPGGKYTNSGTSAASDCVLMEGWLLIPPQDKPVTPGILAFDNLWRPIYAFLTPRYLGVIPDPDRNETLLACYVADINIVERLSEDERQGFEPFCLGLADGSHLFFAATQPLESSLWVFKLECSSPFTLA